MWNYAIFCQKQSANWIPFYDNFSELHVRQGDITMPGSHGSLTKAGKVRESTPKVKGRERHSPIPRVRNKRNYHKRVIQGQTIGVRK